jgi:DNA-binding CsgD family transcriptional regulator
MGALIEEASTCRDASKLRTWVLRQIGALLPFDSAMFLSPRLHEAPSWVNKEHFHKLYWNYANKPSHYQQGLEKGRKAAQKLGGAFIDTEVFSVDDRQNLPIYADMMRPQGINCQIVARPTLHDQLSGTMYLCRHGIGQFRAKDLDQILRFLPVIALSYFAVDALAALAEPDPRDALTKRENEVAELACKGLTNPEIAGELKNKTNTVHNQMRSICHKLHVSNRAELAGLLGPFRARRPPRP